MDEKEIAEIEARANAAQALLGLDRTLPGASDVLALIAEVRRLRKVLQFYAEDANWVENDDDYDSIVGYDSGDAARFALGMEE